MILIIAALVLQPSSHGVWLLLGGHEEVPPVTLETRELVGDGRIPEAELHWLTDRDPPASRAELLSALAWNHRFEILPLMSVHSVPPPDVEDLQLGRSCAVICALGWMIPRSDGLFHGEEPVTRGDLVRLAEFFPEVPDTLDHLPSSMVEDIVP